MKWSIKCKKKWASNKNNNQTNKVESSNSKESIPTLSIQLKRKSQPSRTINLERKEKNTNTNRKSNRSQEIFISFFKNDILLYHKIRYLLLCNQDISHFPINKPFTTKKLEPSTYNKPLLFSLFTVILVTANGGTILYRA